MRVRRGNIWDRDEDTLVVVPTNLTVGKWSGRAVMGAGLAKQAAAKYPDLPYDLGKWIREHPTSRVLVWMQGGLICFPVKHRWEDDADLNLIRESARDLRRVIGAYGFRVQMPKVGCGNGGLSWKDVERVLDEEGLTDLVEVVDVRRDGRRD